MEIRFVTAADLPAIIALEEGNFPPQECMAREVLSFYVEHLGQTCLLVEDEGVVAGHLLATPMPESSLTDFVFEQTALPKGDLSYLGISSLSIAKKYQGQGLGTLLLAALKEVAVAAHFKGICLTCKEELISYYQMNGFSEMGLSSSQLGGEEWVEMYWESPSE
ncbi:GNAT family N-acetyltransferase [Streptococcus gallolyticus]|uniref:GNAT family N-acetyltransferase n=1 Tax=Streptococcus hepaticus TaxID=3349163 RepID=UPI001C98B31D|nr:GNAT family N-acetyltransferase [Streptococcus gallolyticus]MBY5040184.1 GNAT family N-acetyltransferase [Streptococcus gallolyticus]